MIVPLADWYAPLGIAADGDDPLPILAPLYCCLVEAVVPLAVDDLLTARAWSWAKEILDTKPRPKALTEWQSRWRNFVMAVWKLIDDHHERFGKMERARARKRRPPPLLKLEL